MTWGQFKEIVEKQGIKDSDMISYIDYLGMGEPGRAPIVLHSINGHQHDEGIKDYIFIF